MYIPLERFNADSGEAWVQYIDWSELTQITDLLTLDMMLCPTSLSEIRDEYWDHIVNEDNMLNFFTDFDYLLAQLQDTSAINILGVIRAPHMDVSGMAWQDFRFHGYDLLDRDHSVSALTNCGGFPDVFSNAELSANGLIRTFDRAVEIQRDLKRIHPEEHHADCNIWAVFKWEGSVSRLLTM